jgi:hypothetical protein
MMITFDPDTHTYTLDGQTVPSVTQVLQAMGFVDSTWFTEESRTRGKYVHRIIELHINQELDESTVDDSLAGYFGAFKLFCSEGELIRIHGRQKSRWQAVCIVSRGRQIM